MHPRNQFSYIHRQLHLFRRHHVTLTKQAIFFVVAVGFVLYSIFFTDVSPIHDVFHKLRHAMSIIPCH
jgi:hypothetical protein